MTETVEFWRNWLPGSTYRGRWREMVVRSALTLKLMTYAPTGGIVAAPTAALPEQAAASGTGTTGTPGSGTARSPSTRCSVSASPRRRWRSATGSATGRARQVGDGPGPLKIMYRVDGSSDLTEVTLDHFEGWRGSRPVRIGNGAADQLQLDIYGEMMDAMFLADYRGVHSGHQNWVEIARLIDWLCEHWDQPDEGIWETRGGRRDFVYGRIQSWVALDRAIKMATSRARPPDLQRWRTERDAVYNQVFEKGWNPKVGGFTQFYGSEVLDSSLLMMPLQGLIAPPRPMWLSTLRAIDRELVSDSLVYRYNPSASPDGLAGNEGTFSLCTFWYVDTLARAGRLDEAQLTFEKMHTYANHLGLYSEEIGSTGEQLGNFPQAFSHLALISAAVNLDHQLDHGAGVLPGSGP